VYLPNARYLPRAPFPKTGCYPAQGGSHTSSESITPPSSLLRAHAPHHCPPTDLGVTRIPYVLAGCREPLLHSGGSRRYLHESFPGCLVLYPGGSSGARARFFPVDIGLPREDANRSASHHTPLSDFTAGGTFAMTDIPLYVQASRFACHPDRSHRSSLRHWAALAFTSEQNACRYLHAHRIC
jgi:hypothetical protein